MIDKPNKQLVYDKHDCKVFVFLHYYLPGYESGGPLRSIANMVDVLGEEFNFHIITCNHDLLNREPFLGVSNDCWTRVGKAKVWYVSGRPRGLWALLRELRQSKYAILYLNSLFDLGFSFLPLVLVKLGLIKPHNVVIAPRGEFSAAALHLKAIKKKFFLVLCRALQLHRNVLWHASTDLEKVDITNVLLSERSVSLIHVASDLTLPSSRLCESASSKDLLFLSRIARMKNLDYALRVLAMCKEAVTLHIYGTVEDVAYWKECQALIEHLPAHILVVFHGSISPAKVSEVMSCHGLLFFPTRGENFGHVIAEALSSGLPVLISDQTPWGDVTSYGAGWVLPLDSIEAFAAVIDDFMRATLEERHVQRNAVRDYAMMRLCQPDVVDANRRLFTWP